MSSFSGPFNQSNIQNESISLLSANLNSDNDESEFDYEQRLSYWDRFVSLLKRIFLPKGEMPHDDRINMDWLQKWRKYNRFPFKLLVHLVITICLTSIIFIQTGDLTEYSIGIEGTWYKIFFPNDFQYEGDYGANIVYLYTVQDAVDLIQNDLIAYNNFTGNSVNKFIMINNGNAAPPYDATLLIAMYKNCDQVFDTHIISANTDTITTSYTVNSNDLGPLNPDNHTLEDLQQMFFCMESITLRFEFSNIHLQYDHPVEYTWTVDIVLDNTIQSGRISTTIVATKSRVTDLPYSKLIQSSKMILEIILIIFSLLSQIMAWRSFMFSFKTFQRTKRLVRRISTKQKLAATINWGSLPVRTKLRFFNLWFIVCFVCNFCTIIGATLDFFEANASATKLLIGFATLLSWINLIRYLEFDPKSIALIRALGSGLPTILRFSAGSLPIFIGFALFGLMYFSETSSRFSSIGEAMVTLFGLQNGDDIQSTFRATEKNPIVSKIYFFVFVFISMYAVANIYIAIMEGAYSQCVGIKSKLQRKADEDEERKNGGGDDELNLDDELWSKLLGLSSESDSDSEAKKRRKKNTIRRLRNKFQTNKKLTESQILTTDRAVDTLDMNTIVEDISKSILEKQVEFNKEIQKLVKASIHSRIESLIQSQKLSVSNKPESDSSNSNNNNVNASGNITSSTDNNNNNSIENANVINFYTDPESDDE